MLRQWGTTNIPRHLRTSAGQTFIDSYTEAGGLPEGSKGVAALKADRATLTGISGQSSKSKLCMSCRVRTSARLHSKPVWLMHEGYNVSMRIVHVLRWRAC